MNVQRLNALRVWIALSALWLGCRGGDDRAGTTDSALPVESAALRSPGVNAAARVDCDSVALRWRSIPRASVDERDTVVTPENRNSVDQSQPPEVLPPTPACVVVAEVDADMPHELRPPTPAGWTAIWLLTADGVNSGRMTFQRGLVRCQVNAEWDMGESDTTDTATSGKAFFAETVVCWGHNRLLVPADTGQPP